MQAGQKSLLQTTLEDKSSMKNFLRFASKILGLRMILICSFGKSCHNFGKLYRGKTSREVRLEWTCWSWSKFRSWISFSPMFLIEFFIQTSLKEEGRNDCENLCINCNLLKEIRSGKGRICNFLNKGSVCELYEDPVIIRMADFCILNKSFSGPELEHDQIWIAYNKWQWKIELYKSKRLFWLRVFFTILKAYKAFESLLLIFEMWYLNEREGSKKTPKNLTAGIESSFVTLWMRLIWQSKSWFSLLLLQNSSMSLKLLLEKRIKLVLSGWRTIRFIRKNSHTFWNSEFTIRVRILMSSWESSKVVSSANKSVRKD